MFNFIPQYKGKDLNDVVTKAKKDKYFSGIKYDGNYVQIHKVGSEVMLFTSGGKPFKLLDIEADLVRLNPNVDFILEAEYIGLTDGKLGSRGKCTTTTWRTNYAKGLLGNAGKTHFKVFDILIPSMSFSQRLEQIENIKLGNNLSLVQFDEMPLKEAINFSSHLCEQGWEGNFNYHNSHTIKNKGRSNLAIKIKKVPTADVLCIDVKYSDINPSDIGSLLCVNSTGIEVAVGGLTHNLKSKPPSYFIDRVIEMAYESIGINTYLQPRFKRFRDDKTKEEIN